MVIINYVILRYEPVSNGRWDALSPQEREREIKTAFETFSAEGAEVAESTTGRERKDDDRLMLTASKPIKKCVRALSGF